MNIIIIFKKFALIAFKKNDLFLNLEIKNLHVIDIMKYII